MSSSWYYLITTYWILSCFCAYTTSISHRTTKVIIMFCHLQGHRQLYIQQSPQGPVRLRLDQDHDPLFCITKRISMHFNSSSAQGPNPWWEDYIKSSYTIRKNIIPWVQWQHLHWFTDCILIQPKLSIRHYFWSRFPWQIQFHHQLQQ